MGDWGVNMGGVGGRCILEEYLGGVCVGGVSWRCIWVVYMWEVYLGGVSGWCVRGGGGRFELIASELIPEGLRIIVITDCAQSIVMIPLVLRAVRSHAS